MNSRNEEKIEGEGTPHRDDGINTYIYFNYLKLKIIYLFFI